jgi:site-specific DNA-methyltransferase (adenine-specific)
MQASDPSTGTVPANREHDSPDGRGLRLQCVRRGAAGRAASATEFQALIAVQGEASRRQYVSDSEDTVTDLPVNQIICGDNVETLRTLPDACVDSCVTDPPYGLSFMGKKWDYDVPSVEVWQECLRVLKPGGHLLAFAGTRTQHRMAVRIEDAGFDIRDMIAWCYGSGFPKSLDVSKAIDAQLTTGGSSTKQMRKTAMGNDYTAYSGAGNFRDGTTNTKNSPNPPGALFKPATEAAKQWAGWGTALKPSLEPITVARKPLCGTVAENVLQHGTGGLNVDGCRVGTDETLTRLQSSTAMFSQEHRPWKDKITDETRKEIGSTSGRWPANLIHDGSDEVVGLFPEDGDASAARFFYCAKAGPEERRNSKHPTIKPVSLMRYLVRLVTPPGGLVLDPFGGSGTTAEAARLEHCRFLLMELSEEYCADAAERLRQGVLF